MKLMRRLLFALSLCCTICLCVACGYREAAITRSRMEDIRVGMNKAQVVNLLGEPLKDESYASEDVWFYYTRPRWYDGQATQDECTPFFFDANGLLAGWGIDYARTMKNASEDLLIKRNIDYSDQNRGMVIWNQNAVNRGVHYP